LSVTFSVLYVINTGFEAGATCLIASVTVSTACCCALNQAVKQLQHLALLRIGLKAGVNHTLDHPELHLAPSQSASRITVLLLAAPFAQLEKKRKSLHRSSASHLGKH
jgi:hypothetical protein